MFQDSAPQATFPLRERAPTIPFDLSEYARAETGPESWSAARADASLDAWAEEDGIAARTTELLVKISPADIPRVTTRHELLASLSFGEALVVDTIDGESSLETLLDTIDMPAGEALTIVCELCANGVIVLE